MSEIIYSGSTFTNQLNSLKVELNQSIKKIKETNKAFQDIIDNDELQDEAYANYKNFISQVVIPFLQLHEDYYNELIYGVDVFVSDFEKHNPLLSANSYVDTTKLQETINYYNKQKLLLLTKLKEGKFNHISEDDIDHAFDTAKMQKIIDEMKVYDPISANIFYDAIDYQTILNKGIETIQLANNTRNYDVSAYDLDWSKWAGYSKEEKTFIKTLGSEFGFDDETIKLIMKVRKQIYPSKSKYNELSQSEKEEIDKNFLRVMSLACYDSLQWDIVSGSELSLVFDLAMYPGLSEKESNKLLYQIKLQDQMAGESTKEGIFSPKVLFGGTNNNRVEQYKKKHMKAFGLLFINDEEFKQIWTKMYLSYHGKSNYAHFCNTSAAYLESNLTKDLLGNITTNDLSGWLGDATIMGDDGNVSFGQDDYKADLDAANIHHVMEKESLNFIDASNKYYREVGKDYTRANYFTKNVHSISYVKKAMIDQATTQNFALFGFDFYDYKGAGSIKNQKDAYNFYHSLKNGDNELVQYLDE